MYFSKEDPKHKALRLVYSFLYVSRALPNGIFNREVIRPLFYGKNGYDNGKITEKRAKTVRVNGTRQKIKIK